MDTSTALGRLMLGILSAFAQLERENIRERTRMGMRERVKSGLWMGGGRVPFGYDYDESLGILVPNADAATVRRIYELYILGYSLNRIAQIVGLKYEKLAYQILTRKTNAGIISYNGEEYPGRHEAIIPIETYERAMALLRERSIKNLSTSSYLLTGLVHCGKCGAKMRYQKWGKHGCKLVCYSQDKHKTHLIRDPDCPNERPWAEDIERIVIDDLFDFCLDKHRQGGEPPQSDVLASLRGRYSAVAAKIKRLYTLYADDENDLLLETIASYRTELDKISKQIELEIEHSATSEKIMALQKKIENLSDLWPHMTPQEKQTVIRSLVGRIEYDSGTVRIDYTF